MEKHECYHCGLSVTEKTGKMIEVYNSPFDSVPEKIWVHTNPKITYAIMVKDGFGFCAEPEKTCEDYLYDHSWGDFRFFKCFDCGRIIHEQCPENGWHVQYRDWDGDTQICLGCYEKNILQTGVQEEDFECGIPGMFFGNDLEDSDDWEKIETVWKVQNKDMVMKKCFPLWKAGRKVLINYIALAIGGFEGHIEIWAEREMKTVKNS